MPLFIWIGGSVATAKNREIDARSFYLGPIDFSLPFTYVDAFIRADTRAIPPIELVEPVVHWPTVTVGLNRARHYAIGGIGGGLLERA